MPFNYYQSGQPESLSPAYQMLLEATMAKANATGNLLNPLIDALKSNREYGLQKESIDARRAESESEAAWKQRYGDLQTRGMDINERELGLKERDLDAEIRRHAASDANFARALGDLGLHPDGVNQQPATGGGMGGVSPQSLLGGGGAPQQQGGGMGFDPRGLESSQINTLMSMQGRMDTQRKDQQSQQDTKQRTDEMRAIIKNGLDAKYWTKTEADAYERRALNPSGFDALGKELSDKIHEGTNANRDLESYTEQKKTALKDVKSSPTISPEAKRDFASFIETLDVGPGSSTQKSEKLTKAIEDLYGIGKTKPQAQGVDLPGIGTNITLNTSLKNPGTYKVGEDGKPDFASLPQDARSELTLLAKQSLRGSPIFDSMLAEWMQAGMGGTEEQKKLVNDRMMDLVQNQMGLVLDTLGWKAGNTKEDARPMKLPKPDSYSMDEQGKVQGSTKVPDQTQNETGPAVAALGIAPDAVKSAYDMRDKGRAAVVAHLTKIMEPQPDKEFKPDMKGSLFYKEWLKNNPEPNAAWNLSAATQPWLGDRGWRTAHNEWLVEQEKFLRGNGNFDTSDVTRANRTTKKSAPDHKGAPMAKRTYVTEINTDGTPRK